MTVRVGIIGTGDPNTGRNPEEVTKSGFSVAYRHAPCYQELERTELVGCSDLVEENREAFAETFDLPAENAYEDYVQMIEDLDLDMVDVCTPVTTHVDIVVDCATAGVEAIHCEKPMANTWDGAQRMAQECWRRDVQLTFNHQRRFGDPFREALRLHEDGEIGTLERIEMASGPLFSYGSHSIDLCGMFNDERPAEWVLGNVDYRKENVFSKGAHNENQVIAQWQYDNGVYGLAASGPGGRMIGAHNRLVGTDGVIEVGPAGCEQNLRIKRSDQTNWEKIDTGEGGLGGLTNGYPYMIRAIGDAVDAFVEGYESELSAKNSLKTAEIIFGAYESARRRGRVDLPLEIDDNPLVSMVEAGDLDPAPSEE